MQGLVLFVLTDFPEVPFPSLVNDSEHTGDGSANNSDLGKFGNLNQQSGSKNKNELKDG